MSRIAFTLIELIVVIIIIGIVSFLVIKLPSFSSSNIKIEDLRDYLYPNKTFYLFDDGEELVINKKELNKIKDKDDLEKIINKSKVNIPFLTPVVYVYDGEFKKKDFRFLFDKKIVFKYSVCNGIGDSFILKNGDKFYVFKPFFIKKVNNFEKAKEKFLLTKYLLKAGEYY